MGCFLIGVTGKGFSKTQGALLGSVSDDPYDVRTFMKAVTPKEGYRHLGTELVSTTEHTLTDRGYFARPGETTRGINEAGLAFTCAMIFEDEKATKKKNPTTFADLTEQMLNQCRNVQEAINLFQTQPSVNPPYSLLLADAKGNLAHLEVGNFGVVIHNRFSKTNPGAVIAVNCYISKELIPYNNPNAVINNPSNNNTSRRIRGEELIGDFKEGLGVSELQEILSDHANVSRDPIDNPLLPAWGYSICNHGTRGRDDYPKEDLPWGTVSAEIMQPESKSFRYCYGWPCGQQPKYRDQLFQQYSWGKFIEFQLPATFSTAGTIALTTTEGKLTTTP